MVKVLVWGSLRSLTGGKAELEVDAANTLELLDRLSKHYPALKPAIERGVSVSIDGTIYKEAWFTPIKPDSEVVLLPLMVGG